MKVALTQTENQLEEDKTAIRAQKRETKVNWPTKHSVKKKNVETLTNLGNCHDQVKKEVEIDNASRRKAARKVSCNSKFCNSKISHFPPVRK